MRIRARLQGGRAVTLRLEPGSPLGSGAGDEGLCVRDAEGRPKDGFHQRRDGGGPCSLNPEASPPPRRSGHLLEPYTLFSGRLFASYTLNLDRIGISLDGEGTTPKSKT